MRYEINHFLRVCLANSVDYVIPAKLHRWLVGRNDEGSLYRVQRFAIEVIGFLALVDRFLRRPLTCSPISERIEV
jgi:hypothetical protein